MWQANHTNVNIRLLKQFFDTNNLCLLNDATPTRYGIDSGANILDLAITTNTLASKSFCKVIPYNCGIDHRLLQITINSVQSHYRPNIQNAYNIQYPSIPAP